MDDDDKEKTPETEPKTEPSTDPPADPPPTDHHAECKGMIHGLSERIEELENTVKTVISIRPDTTPVRKPWTHRGRWN